MVQEAPLPEDGDPSPDERTLAVTQAMEEIERSRGVTIVDVESDADVRSTIGEQVEAAPAPEPGTEEGQIQQGLREVSEVLEGPAEAPVEVDEVEDRYESEAHGLVPVGAEEEEEAEPEEEVEVEEEAVEEQEEAEEEEVEEEEPEEAAGGDPYSTGGLLRRLRRTPGATEHSKGPERNYSSFDWRGRPLD
jgi:hypothetical protein